MSSEYWVCLVLVLAVEIVNFPFSFLGEINGVGLKVGSLVLAEFFGCLELFVILSF